jgi:hypothetical protein
LTSLKTKIEYVALHLEGDAMNWYRLMVDKPQLEFPTWENFTAHFLARWGQNERLTEEAADNALVLLTQDKSVNDYASEFSRLIAFTRHAEHTQMVMFKHGLKSSVKRHLIGLQKQPQTLADLITVSVLYDEELFAVVKQEKRSRSTGPPPFRGRSDDAKHVSVNSVGVKRQTRSKSISHEERRRRRDENLCRYCGEATCPGAQETAKCRILLAKNAQAPLGKASQQ